jgi:hypothetical protein
MHACTTEPLPARQQFDDLFCTARSVRITSVWQLSLRA